jgi:hypothetical protein
LLPYLPTKHFPSDHLKIEAVLSFKWDMESQI